MSLIAGPVRTALAAAPCALARTGAHHSLGMDTWNTSYPRPESRLDAALLFLSFPDSRPFSTPAELVADHFPATSEFFSRASYGALDLRPRPHGEWIEMPAPSTSYGIERDWGEERRGAYLRDAIRAADPRVDFSRYDIVYLIADPDAPGVLPDATKVVNFAEPLRVDGADLRRVVTLFEQSPPDRNVLAHETGHVFDLPDLYERPRDGKGDWDSRVGDWDMMGSQFGLAPDPFGWHKWKLGWLDERNVECVPEGPGTTRYSLRPLGAALDNRAGWARGTRDTRLAVVRTSETHALAIEARGRIGNDRDVCRDGVLLYRVRSDRASTHGPVEVVDGHPATTACHGTSVHPPLADAPLRVGESHTLDGLRVEVTSRASDGAWEIKVTRE
ncbi:M6 family metalloprotease domain-containing protein [Streptomyces sp. AJS327]|nr:M6 family metalloprotease domain-containing protein [Streptomyces sp. AJS327]MBA0049651.1 M6 family metalloprotease domain-containing protein [Streptomyces sp. AJS327]